MKTRGQNYALKVWQLAEKSSEQANFQKNQYGGMAHQMPVLIQTCGLAQAVIFVAARGQSSHFLLLHDLSETLGFPPETRSERGRDGKQKPVPPRAFPKQVREAELDAYMMLSLRATEALLWFKRFAQSELKVTSGADTGLDAAAPQEQEVVA